MSKRAAPYRSGGDPLVYFGDWCGPGWSAGQWSKGPLTPEQIRRGGAAMIGRSKASRPSPVDLACWEHDFEYNKVSYMNDAMAQRRAIFAADRRLLAAVSRLFDQNVKGEIDLNMGEVIFAQGVQLAFGTKMIWNGALVGINLTTPFVAMRALRRNTTEARNERSVASRSSSPLAGTGELLLRPEYRKGRVSPATRGRDEIWRAALTRPLVLRRDEHWDSIAAEEITQFMKQRALENQRQASAPSIVIYQHPPGGHPYVARLHDPSGR